MIRMLVAACAVLSMFLVYAWAASAQAHYLEARRSVQGRQARTLHDLVPHYSRRPWRWLVDAGAVWREQHAYITSPQLDSNVEIARMRYERRQRIAVAAYVSATAIALAAATVPL